MVYSSGFNPIKSIPINITIPMLRFLKDIERPTEMQCKFNSTKCRLLKLTDYYAEVDSKTIEGPYVIQRVAVNKIFDY